IFLAKLVRLLADELFERRQAGGTLLPGLGAGLGERLEQGFDLLRLRFRVRAGDANVATLLRHGLMFARQFCFMLLLVAQALNAEHGVLGTAVTFFFDLELLLPQRVVERIALLDGIEAETLAEVQPAAVRILAQQVLDFPFGVSRWFLRSPAEVDVILHLEAAHLVFQYGKFFIHSQEKNSLPGGFQARRKRTIPQKAKAAAYAEVQAEDWALDCI